MGLKEVAKWTFLHTTPLGLTITSTKLAYNALDKTVEGYLEEGNLKGVAKGYFKGLTSNIRNETHDALENSPVTAPVYYIAKNEGVYEGKKEGYNTASSEYKDKIDNLEKNFSEQKKEFENEKNNYESIIDGYEEFISKNNI